MEKIKVIDLLVDIANNGVGEEIKFFKHFDRMRNREYTAMINLSSIIHKLDNGTIKLNDPIEIIEDTPKEIYFDEEDIKAEQEATKKLSIEKKDNFFDYYKEDKKIEYLDYLDFKEYSDEDKMWCLLNKINEVIDKVNGE